MYPIKIITDVKRQNHFTGAWGKINLCMTNYDVKLSEPFLFNKFSRFLMFVERHKFYQP